MPYLHAFVSGYVQGVNFRYYTKKFAKKLGLKGFVRNLDNNRVEVFSVGEKRKLDELLKFLRKGPFLARVHKIDYKFPDKNPFSRRFTDFEIVY